MSRALSSDVQSVGSARASGLTMKMVRAQSAMSRARKGAWSCFCTRVLVCNFLHRWCGHRAGRSCRDTVPAFSGTCVRAAVNAIVVLVCCLVFVRALLAVFVCRWRLFAPFLDRGYRLLSLFFLSVSLLNTSADSELNLGQTDILKYYKLLFLCIYAYVCVYACLVVRVYVCMILLSLIRFKKLSTWCQEVNIYMSWHAHMRTSSLSHATTLPVTTPHSSCFLPSLCLCRCGKSTDMM